MPLHDDRSLFEMLILEGTQAGLNWLTILRKRPNYRRALADFQIEKVAAYTDEQCRHLLADPGLVRNRLKIESARKNARAALLIQQEFGSLAAFLWRFVDYRPRQNSWEFTSQIPASTEQSDLMSRALKKRGCNFVGPTICYAFMQAVGMVNDHLLSCYRHAEIREIGMAFEGI